MITAAVAKTFGQAAPAAGVVTKLVAAAAGKNRHGMVRVQNCGAVMDLIAIAIVPGGGAPATANWLPNPYPLRLYEILKWEIRIEAADEVYVMTTLGTSVFLADGMEATIG